jgi:hypothetical protein
MTIKRCITSFLKRVHFKGRYRFLVNIDVINKKKLSSIKKFLNQNKIEPLRIKSNPDSEPFGLTETINFLYSKIESKYYFCLEDDWIFLKDINLDDLIDLFNVNDQIDHIRLSKRTIKDYCILYYKINKLGKHPTCSQKNIILNHRNLVKTFTWSFNPSLNRTSTIKYILPVPYELPAERYFCKNYEEIYSNRGNYILGKIGDKPYILDIGRSKFRIIKKNLKNFFGIEDFIKNY